MPSGIKIAKPGFKVQDSSEHMYVDSATPLLKLAKKGFGFLVSDGTTVKSRGDYGVETTGSGAYLTTIPHGLGYVPVFMAWMDAGPGSNRTYLANASTANVTGGLVPFAYADAKNLYISALTNSVVFPLPAPAAGDYGFFFYIFRNRAI